MSQFLHCCFIYWCVTVLAVSAGTVSGETLEGQERIKTLELIAASCESNWHGLKVLKFRADVIDQVPAIKNLADAAEAPFAEVKPNVVAEKKDGNDDARATAPTRIPEREQVDPEDVNFDNTDVTFGELTATMDGRNELAKVEYRERAANPLPEGSLRPREETWVFEKEVITRFRKTRKFGALPDFPEDPFHETRQNGRVAVREVQRPTMARNDARDVFDPRRMYCCDSGYPWTELRGYIRMLDGHYGEDASNDFRKRIEVDRTIQDGNTNVRVRVRFNMMGGDPSIVMSSLAQYSSKDLYLPSLYVVEVGKVQQTLKEWDYTLIESAVVPVKYHFRVNDPQTGDFLMDRSLSITDHELMENADLQEFQDESLGLTDNDRVADRVNGKMTVMSQGQLVAAKDVLTARSYTSGGNRTTLIICNVLVLAVIIVLLLRFKRSTT